MIEELLLLDTEELLLVKTKRSDKNQLYLAIMLKFFQARDHYPSNKDLIPVALIDSLSTQLDIKITENLKFNWQDRNVERFRHDIRNFLGYKHLTSLHIEELLIYLVDNGIVKNFTLEKNKALAYEFFKTHKIEPLDSNKLIDTIKLAEYRFEKHFFSKISSNLSQKTKDTIDHLIKSDFAEEPYPLKPSAEVIKSESKIETGQSCNAKENNNAIDDIIDIEFWKLKKDIAGAKLHLVEEELNKLLYLNNIILPIEIFKTYNRNLLLKYHERIMISSPSHIKEFSIDAKYTIMAIFFYISSGILVDHLANVMLKLINKMRTSAEIYIDKQIVKDVKRINGKFDILHSLAYITSNKPEGVIKNDIYPEISREILQELVKDLDSRGQWYQDQVQTKIHSFYSHASRRILLKILNIFDFGGDETMSELLSAITFIQNHINDNDKYYAETDEVPVTAIASSWQNLVKEKSYINYKDYNVKLLLITDSIGLNIIGIYTSDNKIWCKLEGKDALELVVKTKKLPGISSELYKIISEQLALEVKPALSAEDTKALLDFVSKVNYIPSKYKINRLNYEISILEEIKNYLPCKLLWINGGYRYRNPQEDFLKDFNAKEEYYFKQLNLPLLAQEFIKPLKSSVEESLTTLNNDILSNPKVSIIGNKKKSRFKILKSAPQADPLYLSKLHKIINETFPMINLLDILKESNFRVNFTKHFDTIASKGSINANILLKRLLLCAHGIGTNTGLKRTSSANKDATYSDLRYVKRRHINAAKVRAAIVEVINEVIRIRDPEIWGEATTGCSNDSTQVNSWNQNLMSEHHPRYNADGVMIYWHVDGNSMCIYSQLKTCLSSEVASTITGFLRHDSKMNLNKNYTDTHGQSVIGFGISHLLHYDLLPRIKGMSRQKLHYANIGDKKLYPNLALVLKEAIDWDVIEAGYHEMIKYIASLKLGIVEADVLIKHLSANNNNNPVYKAITEIGKAVKTIFLCKYLSSEDLRIEINEALNIVERLNSVMGFIFYGKLGAISTNKTEDQELAVLFLHLLQVCVVHINTLIIQEILYSNKALYDQFTKEDKRALSPLIHSHINPYGLFPLDLNTRLVIRIKDVAKRRYKSYE